MATDSGYERGNYLRVCDICGHRFHFRDLKPIGELRFACPDDAPGLTSMQISRYNARAKPLVVRPNKWAKDYAQTPIYQLAEAQIFNLIASTAPAGAPGGASDPLSAAWSALYMADIVIQNKRPAVWNRKALAVINTCLAYLLTLQYGSPTGAAGTSDNPRYGGILSGANYSTKVTTIAGVAFLKAYEATGDAAYRDAADRCGVFMRHVQSGDVQATAYTVYPLAGGAYHVGGLAAGVADVSGLLATTYLTADVAGLWFLAMLSDVQGRDAPYGDAAATAFFGANRATLATMISELTAFATAGARDSANSGELTPGLSATAPKSVYQAATNGGSTSPTWATITRIDSDDIALALLGLYIANGATAKVSEMLAWLQSFASNAANRTPAGTSEIAVLEGITGTYDPALCPADQLAVTAPFTEASQALYSWASLGVLSPILATTAPAAFKRGKDQLSASQRYSYFDNNERWLGPIGSSGLSLQPFYRNASGVAVSAGGGPTGSSSTPSQPPREGLVFWVKGDAGLHSSGGLATAWDDQSGYGQHLDHFDPSLQPSTGLDTINGVACLSFPLGASSAKYLYRVANMVDRNGAVIKGGGRTIIAIIKPKHSTPAFSITGGPVFAMFNQTQPYFQCLFGLESTVPNTDAFYLWSSAWRDLAFAVRGPNTRNGAGGPFDTVATLVEWTSTGYPDISVYVNGSAVPLSPGSQYGGFAFPSGNPGFMVGNIAFDGFGLNFLGAIAEVLVWDHALSASERASVTGYIGARYSSVTVPQADSSIVRAAKTGMVYRQNPGRYPALRGN